MSRKIACVKLLNRHTYIPKRGPTQTSQNLAQGLIVSVNTSWNLEQEAIIDLHTPFSIQSTRIMNPLHPTDMESFLCQDPATPHGRKSFMQLIRGYHAQRPKRHINYQQEPKGNAGTRKQLLPVHPKGNKTTHSPLRYPHY